MCSCAEHTSSPPEHIPESLGALQARIQQIQAETHRTTQRIHQLESELERTRDAQARAERLAREHEAALLRERRGWDEERRLWDEDRTEGYRTRADAEVREQQWRARYEKVVAEKKGGSDVGSRRALLTMLSLPPDLESLVIVLKDKVSSLTCESASEMAKVQALRERLASPAPRAGSSSTATVDLLERLLSRIELLEGEVKRLTTVVNEAVLVRHEMNQRDRRDAGVDARVCLDAGLARCTKSAEALQSQSTRTRKISGQSQLSDGIQAAAYDGAARRPSFAPKNVETDGESSPSPRSSFADGRRSRRHRHHRDTHHDSRSDEPQRDPAASPFPAIRGSELEKDFFSPVAERKRSRAVLDDLVDEGYGGEEQIKSNKHGRGEVLRVDELERALADSEGRLPPQTIVISVLREIEDDYGHYLG